MNDARKTDALLRRALGGVEAPGDVLLRQVKASLRKEQDMKTNKTTKRMLTLALAAALVLALSVTAYAVLDAGDWFKEWFSGQTQSELTEGQQTYIESAAVDVGQSVTEDGWTVTLQSAMTDGKHVYMKLDIQPPEGTQMPRNIDMDSVLASTDPALEGELYYAGSQWWPDEASGTDGVCTILVEKDIPAAVQGGQIDYSCPLVLTVENLVADNDPDTELLAAGPWRFEFTVTPPRTEELDLISEPIACKARTETSYYNGEPFDPSMLEPGQMIDSASGLETVTEEVTVTVTSLRLSSMGAVLTYEYEAGTDRPMIDPWGLEVELANGGVADIAGSMDSGADDSANECYMSIDFAAPIDLDEVTAVTFQGHPLTLPEK